jgi:hypothetical protein
VRFEARGISQWTPSAHPVDDATVINLTIRLAAVLQHPIRIMMLGLLATGEHTPHQLQRTLRLTPKRTLHHLRRLNEEQLLERTDPGPSTLAATGPQDGDATFALKPGVRALVLTLPRYADAVREGRT